MDNTPDAARGQTIHILDRKGRTYCRAEDSPLIHGGLNSADCGVCIAGARAEPDAPPKCQGCGHYHDGSPSVVAAFHGDFKPSEVDLLGSFPPLAGTYGASELEQAAAIVVRTCQRLGDEWRAVPLRELAVTLDEDIAALRRPVCELARNPFCSPDLNGLVDGGFAEYSGRPAVDLSVSLTARGIAALARWVATSRNT